MGVRRGVGRRGLVDGGHDHQGPAVRGKRRPQVVAGGFAAGASEPHLGREPRPREQVAGRRVAVHGNDEDVGPCLVEPLVPATDRERLVAADLRLRLLALGGQLAVAFEVRRPRVDGALVGDRRSVRAPERTASGERRRRDAPSLTAGGEIEHVHLRDLVVVALRREREPPAVGAPRRRALARATGRQPPRLRGAVDGDDPQVLRLLLLVVGGLRQREDHPAAIGRHRRRADALHQPQSLVRDRLPARRGRLCQSRRRGRGDAGEEDEDAGGSGHSPILPSPLHLGGPAPEQVDRGVDKVTVGGSLPQLGGTRELFARSLPEFWETRGAFHPAGVFVDAPDRGGSRCVWTWRGSGRGTTPWTTRTSSSSTSTSTSSSASTSSRCRPGWTRAWRSSGGTRSSGATASTRDATCRITSRR